MAAKINASDDQIVETFNRLGTITGVEKELKASDERIRQILVARGLWTIQKKCASAPDKQRTRAGWTTRRGLIPHKKLVARLLKEYNGICSFTARALLKMGVKASAYTVRSFAIDNGMSVSRANPGNPAVPIVALADIASEFGMPYDGPKRKAPKIKNNKEQQPAPNKEGVKRNWAATALIESPFGIFCVSAELVDGEICVKPVRAAISEVLDKVDRQPQPSGFAKTVRDNFHKVFGK